MSVVERRLTQTEAVVDAIAHEMRRDPRVFYIGQDVGLMGGSLQGTQGLHAEFGARRIREAPISESAMVGAAIGAALFGQRPIVEISFGEFLPGGDEPAGQSGAECALHDRGCGARAGGDSDARG